MINSNYSIYYQAIVYRSKTWQLVSILRSFEHLAFDRTLEKNISEELSLFEFFIPLELENYFIELMNYFKSKKIVKDFKIEKNRFIKN